MRICASTWLEDRAVHSATCWPFLLTTNLGKQHLQMSQFYRPKHNTVEYDNILSKLFLSLQNCQLFNGFESSSVTIKYEK